jgi:hypothetical protein
MGTTIRPDGGEWDLIGFEDFNGERPAFVGLHGVRAEVNMCRIYNSRSSDSNIKI